MKRKKNHNFMNNEFQNCKIKSKNFHKNIQNK